MSTFSILAKVENLNDVMGFLEEQLEFYGCSMKISMKIQIAVEEIFVNIANYAYGEGEGTATIVIDKTENPDAVEITFIDSGVPYDPLAKADPDVSLGTGEREIGGLGIFMVKKSMDDMHYKYEDGKNHLTLRKEL